MMPTTSCVRQLSDISDEDTMRTLSRHDLAAISGGFSEPRNYDVWLIAMQALSRHDVAVISDGFRHHYDYDGSQSDDPISFGSIEEIENPFLRWTLKAAIVTSGIAFALALSAADDREHSRLL